MKVLSFISSLSLNGGGPSRSVPMLVRGLAEEGVNITLMTIRSDDMNTHALEGSSVSFIALSPSCYEREMDSYVANGQYDLIQEQSVWERPYHVLTKIARKYNIPYIVTPRGMFEPWSLSQRRWKKKLALALYQKNDLKHAACIFTTAEMEAEHVRALGVDVPMSVIPNGIETDGYACRKSMDGVKKQILFLSRIHVKKGIELLIEAFWKVRGERSEVRGERLEVGGEKLEVGDDWNVVIVGNGEPEYIESLKLKVENLGMQDCVKILNPVFGDAKVKLYQESAVFCLPSYSENFGMVVAEAMSCGLPVITTTNCPWSILNETQTGWCIDLCVDNLEKALREAMTMEPSELYGMGQKASRLVRENFDYRSVAQKTKRLYEWILTKENKPEFVH